MTGIHDVAARAPDPRPLRGRLLTLVVGDELTLLVRIGFPQEAGHLVITRAEAAQLGPDATGAVPDPEQLLDPKADLLSVVEAAGADLLREALPLPGGEIARVAPVMQG